MPAPVRPWNLLEKRPPVDKRIVRKWPAIFLRKLVQSYNSFAQPASQRQSYQFPGTTRNANLLFARTHLEKHEKPRYGKNKVTALLLKSTTLPGKFRCTGHCDLFKTSHSMSHATTRLSWCTTSNGNQIRSYPIALYARKSYTTTQCRPTA